MTCLEVEELLSAYVDHQLDPEQMAQMARHIEGCTSCQQSVKILQEMLEQLTSLGDVPLPRAFDETLHQALMAEGQAIRQAKANQNQRVKPAKKRNWKRLSSIAAVFIVGLFSLLLYNNNLEDFANLSGTDRDLASRQERAAVQSAEPEETAEQQNLAVLDKETLPQQNSDSKALLPAQEETTNQHAEQELNSAANSSLPEQPETGADQGTMNLDLTPSNVPLLKSVTLQPEADQLNNYIEQLAQLLDGVDYQVDSCTLSEDGTSWLIEITVTKAGPAGQEIKEGAVYCGQDGELWKKD
ncbi:hypothetical protein Ami103574_09040 [Aminipila butyrica]|uniref:Anti-sigma-W factor RsiW n=1 Tax=Aminipila butyrica TaxID=433296 RepID=A0A858BWK7_9FIRM|nr:zf-HC2 domain-containing protein [Aminipila butyrica]QIB69465.1 hypothetical protein Ami103574_09040 [Aminipila butyrica]